MGFKKHKLEYEPIISDEKDVPVEFANLDNKLTRRQRNFVWIAVNNPRLSLVECASKAGYKDPRQAAVNAGIPISKPAYIVNQVCGSGLRAVILGYQSIKLGEAKNVISGGQENMSLAPHSIFYRDDKKISKELKLIETTLKLSPILYVDVNLVSDPSAIENDPPVMLSTIDIV